MERIPSFGDLVVQYGSYGRVQVVTRRKEWVIVLQNTTRLGSQGAMSLKMTVHLANAVYHDPPVVQTDWLGQVTIGKPSFSVWAANECTHRHTGRIVVLPDPAQSQVVRPGPAGSTDTGAGAGGMDCCVVWKISLNTPKLTGWQDGWSLARVAAFLVDQSGR